MKFPEYPKIGVCRIDVRNPLGRVKLAMKKSA
jgi:hypothetical protein